MKLHRSSSFFEKFQYTEFLFPPHVHIATFARTCTRAHPAIICFFLHLFTCAWKVFVNQLFRGEGIAPFFLHLFLHRLRCNFMLYPLFIHSAAGDGARWLVMMGVKAKVKENQGEVFTLKSLVLNRLRGYGEGVKAFFKTA